MRRIMKVICFPLFAIGWITGFLGRYFKNGWLHGLYHWELVEEKREQTVIETYVSHQMKKEEKVFEKLVPGMQIYDPNSDSNERSVPPTV